MTKTPAAHQETLSMTKSIGLFALSLLLNAFGNVLTLTTTAKIHPSFLGSAYWTAAEANLGSALHWNLFWAFLIFGILTTAINAVLVGRLEWRRAIGNLVFMVPFSAFIQVFADFFLGNYPTLFQGLPTAHGTGMILLYTVINFCGVILIAVAISIYQRVNLVLHPADDLMQILRFKYCHGNATIAMWASYIPPTIMALIALLMTGQIMNFGIGTLFAFLFQGWLTGQADHFVFPNLHHQSVDVGTKEHNSTIKKEALHNANY